MLRKLNLTLVLIVLVMLLWPSVALAAAPTPQAPDLGPVWEIVKPIAVKGGWLALVIVLDLVLGVVTALKQGRFEWQRLADFLGDYGPKIAGWLALEALNFLPAEYKVLGGVADVVGVGAYGLIFVSATASVLGHAQALGVLPAMERAGLPATRAEGVLIVGEISETSDDESPLG